MPRQRNPNRERAEKLYLDSHGEINLIDIASELGISPGTVRGWKSKDQWDSSLNGTFQTEERNVPKHTERSKPKREPKGLESESTELTDKQKQFVLEYLRDFNATRAAMAVGYSKKTAYSIGWENLRKPEIQAEIDRLKDNVTIGRGLSIQRIIAEWMKIAFTDITDLLEFGQREVPVMTMFGPAKDEEGKPLTKVVNFVDLKESGNVDGTVIAEIKQGKDGIGLKLHDKQRALKELEKYTSFMTEENRLKLEKLRTEVKVLNGETDQPEDDGFIEALRGKAAEVWDDGEPDNEEA